MNLIDHGYGLDRVESRASVAVRPSVVIVSTPAGMSRENKGNMQARVMQPSDVD